VNDIVDRYDFDIDVVAKCYCEMKRSGDGDYVKYDAYEKLKAKDEVLLEALDKIAEEEYKESYRDPDYGYDHVDKDMLTAYQIAQQAITQYQD